MAALRSLMTSIARRVVVLAFAVAIALATMGADGCNTSGGGGSGGLDATPEKLDGSSSREFEADDIARAEKPVKPVQDYCSGAVSEALSSDLRHVDGIGDVRE